MFAEYVEESPLGTVNETKFINKFEEICREIGVHNNLYPVYPMLSWITPPEHPRRSGLPRWRAPVGS
jgi:hypothetical protein